MITTASYSTPCLWALPFKSVLTQPCFRCADSQSPPRLCSCLSLILRPCHRPQASRLSSSPVPVVRDSQAFPERSSHWGPGVGGEGVHGELRQQMTWPSKKALKESWVEQAGGRVPYRGMNNKGQDERAADFPQGSENLRKQAGPPTSLP